MIKGYKQEKRLKMDVYRIDTPNGEYHTLTEKELHSMFTSEELEAFENDEQTFFYKTKYTVRQLNQARKLYNDDDYCEWFEDEYMQAPSVYDILKLKY